MDGKGNHRHPRLYRRSSGPALATLLLLVALHVGSHPSVVHSIRVPEKAGAADRTAVHFRTESTAAGAQAVPRSTARFSHAKGKAEAGAAAGVQARNLDPQLNGGAAVPTPAPAPAPAPAHAPAPAWRKPIPFVLLHGAGEACKQRRVKTLVGFLAGHADTEGFCLEVGNGVISSVTVELTKQAEIVCSQVKDIAELNDGYNIVGLSQGNLVGRAVVEYCEHGPPVYNFVSIGGPHAGVAAVPLCSLLSHKFCELLNQIIKVFVYSPAVQSHFAPAEYLKIPSDLKAYYKGSKFLPKLNNEVFGSRNATYKKRFSALNKLALIQFENDKVLIPPSTAWFGFYSENGDMEVLAPQDTELYRYDWIGLKALDKAGNVSFIKLPRGHLEFTDEDARKHIIPYLKT